MPKAMTEPGSDGTSSSEWGTRGTAAATFAARLSFENVSHTFGRIEAVKNVSLELAPGEIVCLLGPSGCGKTTLLRIAAGVERQTQGRVLLDGMEISGPGVFIPPEKRGIGLMFQDFALFPHLSILDNVAFGLRGLDRNEAVIEARRALDRVGMLHYERSYPHVLSGGEQQRVALARAIVPRPSVLLMDEPFSGLDQRLRDSVRDETLAVLKETRASSLLVTHDPEEAMRMADRIVHMRDGHVVQTGTPREIYSRPVDESTARFFGDLNELSGVVRDGRVATMLGSVDAAGFDEGEKVDVLVRPIGLQLSGTGETECMVVNSRFLGDHCLLTLAVSGQDGVIRMRLRETDAPESGTVVRVAMDPSHVFVFSSSSGGRPRQG